MSLTYYFQKVLHLWHNTSEMYHIFDILLWSPSSEQLQMLCGQFSLFSMKWSNQPWHSESFRQPSDDVPSGSYNKNTQQYSMVQRAQWCSQQLLQIRWYFQHVHSFLWGSDDFGGNVMLHIEYLQSALQSCIPWVRKSIPEMLLVGDFIIRAILRCGAPWLWSSGGWPWSAPTALRHCTMVQYR